MAKDEKLFTTIKWWATQRNLKRFRLIAYEKLLDKEFVHPLMIYLFDLHKFIKASIPNPGQDGPSINSWNSSIDISCFT